MRVIVETTLISLSGRPQIRITRLVKYGRLPNTVPTAINVTEYDGVISSR